MRKSILLLFLSLPGSLLLAQNLNPTVEVTNTYDTGARLADKPLQQVNIPDSVLVFNLDFDYDALDKPYKGSYEFRPYRVELRPQAPSSTENKFYLRAGAGYTLHPELELVWSPVRTGKFGLNVWADHHSYFGNYWDIAPQANNVIHSNGGKWAGADMGNGLGVDAGFEYSGGKLSVGLAYENAYNKLTPVSRLYNGLNVDVKLDNLQNISTLYYHVRMKVRSGGDVQTWADATKDRFTDTRFLLQGILEYPLRDSRFGLDASVIADINSANNVTRLIGTPYYKMQLADLRLKLGIRLEGTFRGRTGFLPTQGAVLFPDVQADYRLLGDMMVLQFAATGQNHTALPADLMGESRFLSLPALSDKWDISTERVRLMLGLRGNIAARLGYDLQIGYARWNHGLLPSYDLMGGPLPYTLAYSDYNMFFAELALAWTSEQWKARAHLNYHGVALEATGVTAPSPFTGDVCVLYDWGGRIQVGACAEWALKRKMVSAGTQYAVPGYVDLGLYASYAWTRKVGFWVRAGNLLGQCIQRIPGIAEQGIWVTAGIRLNF